MTDGASVRPEPWSVPRLRGRVEQGETMKRFISGIYALSISIPEPIGVCYEFRRRDALVRKRTRSLWQEVQSADDTGTCPTTSLWLPRPRKRGALHECLNSFSHAPRRVHQPFFSRQAGRRRFGPVRWYPSKKHVRLETTVGLRRPEPERRTPNAKRQTPNAKRQTLTLHRPRYEVQRHLSRPPGKL